MVQKRSKPLLNRKETQSLLTTLKLATTAGALSLTIAGWGVLAQMDNALAATNQPVAVVASSSSVPTSVVASSSSVPTSVPTEQKPAENRVRKINVVQWVHDIQGNRVAVVRDNRGSLWYVMGSDVPRLEQGLSPQVQPQLVQIVTRTRGS